MKKNKVLLETKNLCKEYGQKEGKSIALDNVNLSIYNGELLVILGSSGSGKSTLLNMIGGIDYPTSGEILFNGKDITKYNDDELTEYREKNIGFVFQSFNLLQELTAKENVEMCLKNKNDELVEEVFKVVKLENKQDKGIQVRYENENLWMTQKSIAELFDCSSDNISLHLKNIFEENELDKSSTTEKFSVVQKEGSRNVNRVLEFYNLDAIISVGYRVNSIRATQFRRWATNILKKFTIQGYVLDKERMKNGSFIDKDYFEKLFMI